MTLLLPPELQAEIVRQARAAFPRECCGLIEGAIEGIRGGETARELVLHPARNIAAAEDRFEIAPQDHFTALKVARGNGRALIGCYHSHPNGRPAPSATDHAGAGEGGFFWVIAALPEAEAPVMLAAFVYRDGAFFPVEMSPTGADLVTSSGKARS